MTKSPTEPLGYESATKPSQVVNASLIGEWFRWASAAIALDAIPFALLWIASQGWLSRLHLRGDRAAFIILAIGGVALVIVVRLIRLAIRTRGLSRACYIFLAFLNLKAGVFACAMLQLIARF